MPNNSGIIEKRRCDCCGKDFSRRHEHHVTTNKRFGKDVCSDCVLTNEELKNQIKDKKMTTWEEKYGEHPMKTQECKNKMFNTWKEKFNGHPLHNKEVYLKWEKQMVKNFGGLSPMCDKNVREKALDSLYKNNKIPTSS